MTSYSLLIRGGRDTYQSFDTPEELAEEVRQHLTPSEINSGVLDRLTNFTPRRKDADGRVVNHYRNIETDCYYFED